MLALNISPQPVGTVTGTILALDAKTTTDVITWYESKQGGIPPEGNFFLQTNIIKPLQGRVRLYLYSLWGWGFDRPLSQMPPSTKFGKRMGCIQAMDFFRYCLSLTSGPLYDVFQTLPEKKWLFALSEPRKNEGKLLSVFFENQPSLLSCLYDRTTGDAYAAIQYVEGYYLIRESVRRALSENKKDLKIFFVLPNDEGKYYRDLPNEIDTLLRLDFGDRLDSITVNIAFLPYQYGTSPESRPYLKVKL